MMELLNFYVPLYDTYHKALLDICSDTSREVEIVLSVYSHDIACDAHEVHLLHRNNGTCCCLLPK